jgi:hypothetical protein
MAQRNRVDPYGDIVLSGLRCSWLGNRGCIHRGRDVVRPWNGKRWITCALEFKGWVAPKWVPGRWTALFFYDEALAFAAGHRPCALCRRADYRRYQIAAGIVGADPTDAQLHAERLDGRRKRTHPLAWRELPAGAFVDLEGAAHVVLADSIVPWSAARGYASPIARPANGVARVLTPPLSVRAIAAGYAPQVGIANRV